MPADLAADSVRMRLEHATQVELVRLAGVVKQVSPFARMRTPNGLDMRVRVTNAGALGWTSDLRGYRYEPTDSRGRPWPPIPRLWMDIASEVAGSHPWDSAILNFYDRDASLGWHRDLQERDRSKPIVTISLGDACVWSMRMDDGPVSSTRLESGDVTLLAGPTRLALHTVSRIIPSPLLSPLGGPGRLSITIRCAG